MPRCVWGEGSFEVADDTCFDVVVDGVTTAAFTAIVDGELKLAFMPPRANCLRALRCDLPMRGRASAGCGRTVRWEPVDEVRNVRIVGDVVGRGVFVNDGALVPISTHIS